MHKAQALCPQLSEMEAGGSELQGPLDGKLEVSLDYLTLSQKKRTTELRWDLKGPLSTVGLFSS